MQPRHNAWCSTIILIEVVDGAGQVGTLHIIYHAHFKETDVWYVKSHRRLPTVSSQKRVDKIYCKFFQPGWRFLRFYEGVAHQVRNASFFRLDQVDQFLPHLTVDLILMFHK